MSVQLRSGAGHVGDLNDFGDGVCVHSPVFGVQDDLIARFKPLEVDEDSLPGIPAHIVVVAHQHDIAALARIHRGQGLTDQVQAAVGGEKRIGVILDDAAGIPVLP